MRIILFLIGAMFLAGITYAQLSISIGFNIERQPIWGPAGYDQVEYYYLPDIEVYYNVPRRRFYFYEGSHWISRSTLPPRFRNYDLYTSYKVVVNEPNPYRNHRIYREKYISFKGRRDQQPIRDSRDARYFSHKQHPEHNNWVKEQKRDNGKGNGKSRDRKN